MSVRTRAIEALSEVAVVAKNLQISREIVGDDPSVERATRVPASVHRHAMLLPAPVDVINAEKLGFGFPATRTATPVMSDDTQAECSVSLPRSLVLRLVLFGVALSPSIRSRYCLTTVFRKLPAQLIALLPFWVSPSEATHPLRCHEPLLFGRQARAI